MFRIATQRWNLDRVGSWNISEYQQSVSDSKQEVSGRKKILTWNLKQLVDQGNGRLDQKQNPVTPADYVRRASSPVSVQTSRPPPLGIYPKPSSASSANYPIPANKTDSATKSLSALEEALPCITHFGTAALRIWFLSRFGLKTGIDFDNYGLKSGRVFGAGNIYESLQTYFSSQYVTGTTNW